MRPRVLVVGAGGHGAVVGETVRAAGADLVGFLDADPARTGRTVVDAPVLGTDDDAPRVLEAHRVSHVLLGVGSAGVTAARRAAALRMESWKRPAWTAVHPTAWLAPSATVEDGVAILPGALVHTRARLLRHAIVNTGAIVEHDCVVGPLSHVATGAVLAGDVTLGEAVHIGAGATVRQGIRIGDGAVIGAGAAVVADVSAGATVAGVPARPRPTRAPIASKEAP